MRLHFQHFPQTSNNNSTQTLIVLHGLFGSSNNWRSYCQYIAQYYNVFALDLRNHGKSDHHESMTLPQMAEDVSQFLTENGIKECNVLGHSMGGKVAMQLALSQPVVQKLVIVDIAPKIYPARHDDVFAAIEAIDTTKPKNRNAAESIIKPILPDQAVRLFLISNLIRTEDGYMTWRINTSAIKNNYLNISEAPEALNQNSAFTQPTLFIQGSQSSYIQESDYATIHKWFPSVKIETIAGAGHWVHAEQPEAFSSITKKFFID